MENVRTGKETVEELFFKFMDAQDCPDITHTFQRLVQLLGIKTDNPREFYTLLKGKLQSWRCKSLWELLDSRANQKEYGKGKICEDTHILVIGAGPIGLRTAIEVALLGAQVVIVEKRESFTRNNVLHLWPFLLTDFRSLGAKKFYGKFCSGSIDHISIRKLQATLLKTALIFGAKLHAGVSFDHVIEPNSTEDCWRCKVSPDSHSLNEYEFDVLIGADGKKNVIPGFQQIEMRGTLAIGITANFVNHGTEAEANAEEISGIAYQFNPQFFDDLHERKGIKLENIVYYKDETHYFVMTAGKASLLKRGALKEDLNPSSKLLATSNIDHSKLLEYVTDVVKYATKGTLKNLELKLVANKLPDIAAFDFTSIKKAEHAARIVERKGSKLLVGLVGDSLLEPFWPTGSGCARGVLSALDAAWMVRSFAQEKPPLQILSERENIYRLLSGTSAENLHKTHAKYTINPSTRYLHITQKRIREVYHLYDTDDPVNADFSIGSPQTGISIKASRKRRISTGAKPTAFKGRRGRASSHLAAEFDRVRSTSGSSMENMVSHKPLAATKSEPLDSRFRTHTLGSIGSDDEVFKTKTRRVKMKSSGSPMTGRRGRSSTIGSSADELKDKKRRTGRKRTISRDNLESPKEKTHRKRGFFGFGIGKQKRKADEEPTQHADKNSKSIKWKRGESVEEIEHKRRNGVVLTGVQKREENPLRMSGRSDRFTREESWRRGGQAGSFSREQYTRRSARDIIREMEARAKGESVSSPGTVSEGGQKEPRKLSPGNIRGRQERGETREEEEKNQKNKDHKGLEEKKVIKKEDEKKRIKSEEKRKKEEEKKRKEEEKKKHEEEKKSKEEAKRKHEEEKKHKEEEEKRKRKEEEQKKKEHLHNKRGTQVKSSVTPPNKKKKKKQRLLDEIAEVSPSAKRAMPVLSQLSPDLDKETEEGLDHSVTSAVREAAMVLLVTPLLIDSLTSSMGMDRKGSKLKRDSGRVRDVVNRYNTLNDMKPLLSNGDVTPLKRPRDRVDGPEEKPRRLDTAIGENEENNEGSEQDATIANDEEPSPATGQRRSLVMRRSSQELASSPSLQRLKMKLQDFNDGAGQADSTPKRDRATPIVAVTDTNDNKKDSDDKRTSSNMEEDFDDGKEAVDGSSSSREERVNKDFTSPIWRKTVIAAVAEKSQENKENEKGALNSSTKNNEVQVTQHLKPSNPQSRRRSSALPCEEMEEKLENLLNSATAERAKDSIKYMIGLFKQMQKHPKEEKYHRVFKGRVKFRKHVGIVRNAKLFLVLSGWTEIGSFFVFPLSKHVEEPLQLLNKYLSIAEEKRNEELSTATRQHSNLQRASSSDLAERIMELKDALVSARTTRKYSVDESKKQSLLFQRTVSSDEISRRKNTDLNSSNGDAVKKTNGLQKTGSDFEDDARNIRRSFSENSVYKSTENAYDSSSSFTPFQRTFSERSERDAGVCDVAMENPFGVKTASVKEKRGQASVSSSDDGEVSDDLGIRTPPRGGDLPRQVVSPREAVLEEADHLSSVLGNLIDSLGSSDVTEEEEGSEFEKEGRHTLVDGKPEERAATQHKDEELEALCETLSFLINDDSSDSTESADEVNANVPVGRRNLRRGTRCHDGAFKPPLPPTGRTTKRLDKAKSADETTASKRSSRTNGGVSREKVSKARSLDVTATRGSRNNSGKGEVREMIATRSSTSKINHKNSIDKRSGTATIGQRSGPVTRAQRQKEASSSQVLGTSRVARNKQSIPNKRDSGVVPNGRETKRVDSKRKSVGLDRSTARAKSVDLDRSKARPQAAKSKSVDLTFKGEQRNRIPSSKQSQGIRRSGTLSSSEEDKKKPGTRNAAGTTRVLPASKSTSKGKKGLSSTVKSENRRGKSTAGKKSGDVQREASSSDVEIKSEKSATEEDFTGSASDVAENTAVHLDGNDVKLGDKITISGSTEAEPAMICHKNLSGRDSGIQTDMDDFVVMDNGNTKNDVEPEMKSYDVEITKNRDQKDETQLVASEPEDSNGIVKLSKEIQSYYSNDTSQASRREADVKGIVEDDGNGTKAKQWFPSDSELRAIIQETEGSTAVKEGASELVVDGPRDETESQHKDVSEDQSTVTSATSACRDSKQRNKKKMLSDIGRQRSRGSSKKEVVAFTVEERKQQILEAGVTTPKAKPADKRRSILQIKNRGDGNLVKNTKEAFEKPTGNKKVALESTEMKSAKQRHFRFRGRKKKSFESANGPLDVVSEAQEELREETPVTNGSVKSDQSSHSARLRNGIGLEQAKTSPVKKEEGDTAKGKRPSPVRLSPFRLPFTKRRGSYDLESNSPEITQESPQHYTSENE